MRLIGLLLVGLSAAFTVDVFVENTSDVDVDVLGHTFAVRPGWIVVAGFLAFATFVIGARLVASGVRRARRRRSVLRGAQSTAQERDQLAQQLEAQREHTDDNPRPIERNDSLDDAVTSATD